MYFEVRETQSGLGTSRTGYPVGTGYQPDWVPVGPVTQSGLGTSRTGYQSDWAPSRDWVLVRLGTQSDWVTDPTGTQSLSRGLELVHP